MPELGVTERPKVGRRPTCVSRRSDRMADGLPPLPQWGTEKAPWGMVEDPPDIKGNMHILLVCPVIGAPGCSKDPIKSHYSETVLGLARQLVLRLHHVTPDVL